MAIEINLDVMMAKRKISSNELAAAIGITPANLSVLKTGKAKAIRFSTLEKICEVLQCQPGDILYYKVGVCIRQSRRAVRTASKAAARSARSEENIRHP